MYKATIAYDGTRYFGWQKTCAGPSIQEEFQKAIAQVTGESVVAEAASRTDRGVHAEGQVVQFALEKPIELQKVLRGLNALLPSDIRLLALIPCQFHPTLDAIGKEYCYRFSLSSAQDPMHRLYAWHVHLPLDLAKMQSEAKELVGIHDFSAFANTKDKNPICKIESIAFRSRECTQKILPLRLCQSPVAETICKEGNINSIQPSLQIAHPRELSHQSERQDLLSTLPNLEISIKGNRFLYKMVRNIIGTLVYIGCGKLTDAAEILHSRDRKKAGVTAPAHGLHLHQVFYSVK